MNPCGMGGAHTAAGVDKAQKVSRRSVHAVFAGVWPRPRVDRESAY